MTDKEKYQSIIGQKFGRLTVISTFKYINNRNQVMCECICDCGNENHTIARKHHITSGKIQSCKCLHKEIISTKSLVDHTGQIFGKLTAIERLCNYKNKRTYYKCICSCKSRTEIIVDGGALTSGNTKSCGCIIKELPREIIENRLSWKGGIGVSVYDTYSPKLEPIEETRRDPRNLQLLQIKCIYCNRWFVPTRNQAERRAKYINGNGKYEGRFYCSEECKQNCPIFNKSVHPKGYKQVTSREVQPELRKLVFERDEWTCQKCNSNENLHCHHYEGIIVNPIESADVDNCITLCKSCHKYVHSQKGCTNHDLKCDPRKGKKNANR